MRQINDAGLQLIKSFESLRLKTYDDATGKVLEAGEQAKGTPTIGWGHTGNIQAGQSCTQSQAQAWLAADLAPASAAVQRLVRGELNDNQYAALVSFVFNVGEEAFATSTLLKCLNGCHYDAVPQQLARWNKAGGHVSPGLMSRRAAEAALWVTPPAMAGKSAASAAHDVDAPPKAGHFLTLGGIAIGTLSGMLSDLTQQLQPLAAYGGTVQQIFLIIAVIAAVIAALSRMRSFKREGV